MPKPDINCPTCGIDLQEHSTDENTWVCPNCGKIYNPDDLIHILDALIDGEHRFKLN